MGRKRKTITIDNKEYLFSIKAFQKFYKDAVKNRKKSDGSLIRVIAETVGASESAVKGWVAGNHGSDFDEKDIVKLADLFNIDDHKKLLELVEDDVKKGEDVKMANRIITDSERNAARSLYGEMCDMITLCVWEPPVLEDYPEEKKHRERRFNGQEDARYYYHDTIRRAGRIGRQGIWRCNS